jgi:hypothetical protein
MMMNKKRFSTLVVLFALSLMLLSGGALSSRSAQAASANLITINHYKKGKVVGTHIISDAFYAFAIRSGYWGERLDELYHFCMQEENHNNPKCRHAL